MVLAANLLAARLHRRLPDNAVMTINIVRESVINTDENNSRGIRGLVCESRSRELRKFIRARSRLASRRDAAS